MMEALRYFAYHIAPHLAILFVSLMYIPQIWKTFKSKSVEDLSVPFWLLLNAFLLCLVVNATFLLIDTGRPALGYFLTEIVNFTFAIIQTVQIFIYRKNKKSIIETRN